MLLAIRDYIKQKGTVSLDELAFRFNVPQSAMQGMVQQWVNKNLVQQLSQTVDSCGASLCKSCHQQDCSVKQILYCWSGDGV